MLKNCGCQGFLIHRISDPQITQFVCGICVICGWRLIQLRPYLYAAGFDWYLREIISANKLASTGIDHVIEENLADRVFADAFTIIKNGKESCVKLIIENGISCLPDGAAEAGAISNDLQAGDIELGIVLRVKRRIVNYRSSLNAPI